LFLPHGREETAGGSGVGGLWLVFSEKVATRAQRLFVATFFVRRVL
jgi:hypothetical protein